MAEAAAAAAQRRTENLALAFQEVLTAILRLRSNRQTVSDPDAFRTYMRDALRAIDQEARKLGYSSEDNRQAIFAIVAFLDESVLNSRNPVFANWPRRPLQEELFGGHVAGEIFFQNLQRLLGRQDSQDLADLLEVYYLCILLGYRGRYGIGGQAELRSIMQSVADKIRRIRGASTQLSPRWALPAENVRVVTADPWVRRLFIGAVASLVLAVLLFGVFKISLGSGASDLQVIASQVQR
jgi:type VI secretion system protein ImpK